jgi:hypothetical protein
MVRTGKKEKEYLSLGRWFYRREYECPRCGEPRIYSESGNFMWHPSLAGIR